MNPVFRVSLAASESLKSKILRRVREEEKQLSPEKMNARSSGCSRFGIRRQNQRTTSQQNGTRKLCGRLRSLRSSSRTQMKETCQGSNSETISNSKTKGTSTGSRGRGSGRARARGRGQGRPPSHSQIWVKEEASGSSSLLETSGNSSVAKPRPAPIKRRLRSSTSLVPALSTKVRRLEDDLNREKTAPSSPSSSSTNRENSWVVPESPCGLVIVERKSPGHQRKISISESSAKEFCSSTDDTSCGIVCSTISGRKKKYKVCLTKRLHDSRPATEALSGKKMQPRSNLTRNKVSKQKKKVNDSDGRATRRRSKGKDENMVNAQRTDDHLNRLLQDSEKCNPAGAGALKSLISQTSSGTSRKKHDGLVRELIHRRINETLAAQNGQKEDTKPTTTQSANTVVSSGMSLRNKQQPTQTAEQDPSQSDVEATTNSVTVTETAAVEAAKAVGGISLHKAKNPDFLPTVSSPCTPTMTVMKASSDQTVSSTMSSESNLKGPKSKVPSDPETQQLPSGQSGTSSVLQPLAQCKCVDSVSTVPTPSLIEIGNIQAAQPIFLTPESFQFQPISYPGMAALNLVDPAACLPDLPKQKKKRNPKKKSVEKKSPSAVPSENTLSSVAVSSASSSLNPDTNDSDVKDPSLDDKGEKIKRPMNAFMIWSREQRAILARQTPRMTNADISVKLGIMWNDLDYSEKQKYFDEAIKLKLQHHKDYPDWVYQPRPHKRPSRRKHRPVPFSDEGRQQMPCAQMLLILPDGQQVICPAIPQQACQGAVPVLNNNTVAPAPPVDIKDAKKISQPKEEQTDAVMTNSASSQPVGAKDVKSSEDENKSTTQQSEQAKSKMLVIMPEGKQVECQVMSHQNGQTAKPLTTNTVNSAIPRPSPDVKDVNLVSEQSTQLKSKLLLVMPDGKQVLCPEIPKPETDVKVVKKSVNQPSELSKSSEEKLLIEKSEKCDKCGDKKSTVAHKSQSSLLTATAITLGPVIQLTKDMKNSNTETNISEGKLSSSAQSTKQQETTHEEKKGVTPFEMAVAKDQSETSQGATESAAATKPVTVQSDVKKVTEMKAIVKSDATPVPVAIHVSAIAQVQTSEGGKNQSIAKSSDPLQPQLSNADQQSPLTEMISLQVAPVSSQTPQQDCTLPKATVNALKEMIISSRPHSADDSSLPQRQTIPNNDASQFQTGNFSQPHPAVRLYPLDFHQPVVPLQPMNKDTGIQTLHEWSSCTSNNQTNQTLPSNLPSSVLKNQPINMVWQSDSRILQPVNISDKGTSTSYPFYFTPIQQVQGVQETSNAQPMGSMMALPAVPATVDHCTAPMPTATLTDGDPSDAAVPATQFADTPTLCEISEPERLLESLAMTAVEITEDEAEEAENLFQRVMDMVPN